VAWHYENNGLFSVKSAYKLATALKIEAPTASSKAPDGKQMLWQNIWKAHVPNKVHIFGWRLAVDNLFSIMGAFYYLRSNYTRPLHNQDAHSCLYVSN
jgi:hypothetical protein